MMLSPANWVTVPPCSSTAGTADTEAPVEHRHHLLRVAALRERRETRAGRRTATSPPPPRRPGSAWVGSARIAVTISGAMYWRNSTSICWYRRWFSSDTDSCAANDRRHRPVARSRARSAPPTARTPASCPCTSNGTVETHPRSPSGSATTATAGGDGRSSHVVSPRAPAEPQPAVSTSPTRRRRGTPGPGRPPARKSSCRRANGGLPAHRHQLAQPAHVLALVHEGVGRLLEHFPLPLAETETGARPGSPPGRRRRVAALDAAAHARPPSPRRPSRTPRRMRSSVSSSPTAPNTAAPPHPPAGTARGRCRR